MLYCQKLILGDNMETVSSLIVNIKNHKIENELLEHFGDVYLDDAVRIVNTNKILPSDNKMIHGTMCIIVAMYVNKVRAGEINRNKVYH